MPDNLDSQESQDLIQQGPMRERPIEMFLQKYELFAHDHEVLQHKVWWLFWLRFELQRTERRKKASDQVAWDNHSLEKTLSCNAERPSANWEHVQQYLQPFLSITKELLGYTRLNKEAVIPLWGEIPKPWTWTQWRCCVTNRGCLGAGDGMITERGC